MKTRPTTSETPRQRFDGKQYACVACRKGHRVRRCDHGRSKPIAPTKAPGRPASGSKRVCNCGKDCGCKDDCQCAKNCLCVEKMYLICLVTKPDAREVPRAGSPKPIWTNSAGETETLRPVWADSDGKLLSDEEAERRRREKESRAQSTEIAKPGGCRHREKIKSEPSTAPTPEPTRCTCGTSCQCTLCPEHPNNAATRQYNVSTLNHMASHDGYLPAPSMETGPMYQPTVPSQSCMGSQPRFWLTRNKPEPQDFANFFPGATNGDFVMSYPVDNFPWLSDAVSPFSTESGPQIIPQMSTDVNFDESLIDMNWTQPQPHDDVWGTRLGNASVDQISQFPFDPTQHLQVPPMANPAPTYHAFDTLYQQTPLSLVSSPDGSAFVSTVSSPPLQSLFGLTPNMEFDSHTPAGLPSAPVRTTRSCCGGGSELPRNNADTYDATLTDMPLSPLSPQRIGI